MYASLTKLILIIFHFFILIKNTLSCKCLKNNIQKPLIQTCDTKNIKKYEKYDYKGAREFALATAQTVFIKGGNFTFGTNDRYYLDEELETENVTQKSFYMDTYEVSNEKFYNFINNTKYETDAEKYKWSYVFELQLDEYTINNSPNVVHDAPWWTQVYGAYWYRPYGNFSSIDNILDHPVVHVSVNDAINYCNYVGGRLPTEKEYEYAARGGLEQNKFPWGNDFNENRLTSWKTNVTLPDNIYKLPGDKISLAYSFYTSSNISFVGPRHVYENGEQNEYGLYNIVGNVWEIALGLEKNTYVEKGGSFLCHKHTCNRYYVHSRMLLDRTTTASNLGFRCVYD